MTELRIKFDENSIGYIDYMNGLLGDVCSELHMDFNMTRKQTVRFLVKLLERCFNHNIPIVSVEGITSALYEIQKR